MMFLTIAKFIANDSKGIFSGIKNIRKNLSKNVLRVTITGVETEVGQLLGLFLKQNTSIEELSLHSDSKTCGIGLDLSHIDTNVPIYAYKGSSLLGDAIKGSKIVIMCGGSMPQKNSTPAALFKANASVTQRVAVHCSHFAPDAILIIVTQPVECLLPLVAEEHKKAGTFDPNRLLGMTSANVIRANTIISQYLKVDLNRIYCPVIGGNLPSLQVPVLSELDSHLSLTKQDAEEICKRIRTASVDIFKANKRKIGLPFIEAYSASRFISAVIGGLKGEPDIIECAFINQDEMSQKYGPYLTTPVQLGRKGIEINYLPELNDFETELINSTSQELLSLTELGAQYITSYPNTKRMAEKIAIN